jgi:hypothetical protein
VGIAIASFVAIRRFHVHVVAIVAASAVAGLVWSLLR